MQMSLLGRRYLVPSCEAIAWWVHTGKKICCLDTGYKNMSLWHILLPPLLIWAFHFRTIKAKLQSKTLPNVFSFWSVVAQLQYFSSFLLLFPSQVPFTCSSTPAGITTCGERSPPQCTTSLWASCGLTRSDYILSSLLRCNFKPTSQV